MYDFIIEFLVSLLSYSEQDDSQGTVFYCDEIDLLVSVDFLFGGYWIEIIPDHYVLNHGENVCSFCFTNSGIEEITFGHALLLGYYSSFDMDNMRIGFAPLSGQSTEKAVLESGSAPEIYFQDYEINNDLNVFVFMVIAIGSGLSFIVGSNYLLYK